MLDATQKLLGDHHLEENRALSTLSCLIAALIKMAGNQAMVSKTPTVEEVIDQQEALYKKFAVFCPPDLLPRLPAPACDEAALKSALQSLVVPGLAPLWRDPCTLGFAHQYFCAARRIAAQKHLQQANKGLSAEQLAAFTQLYTPGWVIDFLLANTVLAQWQAKAGAEQSSARDEATLTDISRFLLGDQGADPGAHGDHSLPAQELTVLDPACGAGNFLVRAFDLLFLLYRHEGYATDEALNAVLNNNLVGADIDAAALWVTAMGLFLQCSLRSEKAPLAKPNLVWVGEEKNLLGSLSKEFCTIAGHPLGRRKYAAVVTNPPYIGRKLLSRELKLALKSQYPSGHHDLCAAFLVDGLQRLQPHGRLGFITQSS
ncbi:MAG TPA: DNA methyltransferase, partial [Chroococcales cyanobacterium]